MWSFSFSTYFTLHGEFNPAREVNGRDIGLGVGNLL
ncbi:hypothetical protein J2S74_000467 [Evansella vedderi]|uniref:Uncharacterized protein n=1 Tax=Evansella vedderi TaxID=38282 RepID=A0ABT9ZPC4_9BACI|nr:hypothetical protein [Evansella vedderi]